ncbi:Lin1244/Lin1753 domain-containing protein [Vagococcus salmoninarum]|uniref:Lin1244/Lin1753 domain-containing protein n=1 Tax=Vagococcus salmoninarum TaxID=2739 RepID=UPI0018810979|nr:Lin1244/Lin1753 domain-containing protein [Vagococcus salmoninarum]MBE9390032.1 DUF4373 domain-containing protein [Vagococcus salmoninarum]
MARPVKRGLDYFPFDVDADYDDKFQLIEAVHGNTGFAVVVKLMMKIYKEGFYYQWNEREQLLFSKRVNLPYEQVILIVEDCLKYELFSNDLFQKYNVLTSIGIQSRYFKAIDKRKKLEIIREFLIIDEEELSKLSIKLVNLGTTGVNRRTTKVNQESGTQRKVKESKVKESKEEERRDSHSVVVFFQQNGFGSYTQFIAEDVTYWINDFMEIGSSETEANDLILQALKIAVEKNARSWKFAKGVLKNWLEKAVKNLEMVQANEQEFHTKKANVGFEVEDDHLPF